MSIIDMLRRPSQFKIAIFVSFFIFGPLFYWAMDREPPYTRVSGRIIPIGPMPGQVIEIEWTIKVNRSCTPASRENLQRQIVDRKGIVWGYDDVPGIFGREGNSSPAARVSKRLQLPTGIAAGPASYRVTSCHVCNPLQYLWPICISTPDIQFEVGRAGGQPTP